MPNWAFSLRKTKENTLPPEPKAKPARAMTVLQDVLTRNGSTATLDKLRNHSTTSLASATLPRTRVFQSSKQFFTRKPSRQQSLMDMRQTASPSSSTDDVTLASVGTSDPHDKNDRAAKRQDSGASLERVPDNQADPPAKHEPILVVPRDSPSLVTAVEALAGGSTTPCPAFSNVAREDVPHPDATDVLPPDATISLPDTTVPLPDTTVPSPQPPSHEIATDATIQEELVSRPKVTPLLGGAGVQSKSIVEAITSTPLSPIEEGGGAEEPAIAATSEPDITLIVPPTITSPPPLELSPKAIATTEPLATLELEHPLAIPHELPSKVPDHDDVSTSCDEIPPPGSESARSSWTMVSTPPEPSLCLADILEAPPSIPGGLDSEDLTLSINKCQRGYDESESSRTPIARTSPKFPEENPDTKSTASVGSSKASHRQNDRRIPNIVFFGDTGAGKSSVINMLMDSDVVGISGAADGKTLGGQSYITSIGGRRVALWDTAGLNEVEGGTMPARLAMRNIRDLVGALKDGVSLLVYCVRATRFRPNLKVNYDLVCETICQTKVPVLIVVTGLETQVPREGWWANNGHQFSEHGMTFAGHACITGTRGKWTRWGGYLYGREYQESQKEVRRLIEDCFAAGRPSWIVEDKESWASETSIKLDSYYDVKGQGMRVDPEISSSEASRTQTWWEYFSSYWYGTA